MDTATVFRFDYFDRATGRVQRADDYATEKAIRSMGATILRDTALQVSPADVSAAGLLRRMNRQG
jgi:hypothetical protein